MLLMCTNNCCCVSSAYGKVVVKRVLQMIVFECLFVINSRYSTSELQ